MKILSKVNEKAHHGYRYYTHWLKSLDMLIIINSFLLELNEIHRGDVWQLSVTLMNWVWLDVLHLDAEGSISYAEINQNPSQNLSYSHYRISSHNVLPWKMSTLFWRSSVHTIRKSSKMDGAKYIPNFAFKWW